MNLINSWDYFAQLVFQNRFIKVCMTYSKLHIFKVYNLIGFDIWILSSTCTTIKIRNTFTTPKSFFVPFWNPSSCFSLQTLFKGNQMICLLSLYINLHILECYVNGITFYIRFYCLASFTKHNYFEILPHYRGYW